MEIQHCQQQQHDEFDIFIIDLYIYVAASTKLDAATVEEVTILPNLFNNDE